MIAIAVMICSNGWLDVILYSITRRSLIFGSAEPDDEVCNKLDIVSGRC